MKGRGCLEPGTDHSFCNSGCLGKLNQGQYSSYNSASGGDSLNTPLTPPRRKNSACHLLHLVCLGGIHPSVCIAPVRSGFIFIPCCLGPAAAWPALGLWIILLLHSSSRFEMGEPGFIRTHPPLPLLSPFLSLPLPPHHSSSAPSSLSLPPFTPSVFQLLHLAFECRSDVIFLFVTC